MKTFLNGWLAVILGISSLVLYSEKSSGGTPSKTMDAGSSAAGREGTLTPVSRLMGAPASLGFEQPQAMAPFFARLASQSAGAELSAVHILHFGDSHTAADEWTGGLRHSFQQRFGNGGSGYSLAGNPFGGYQRFGTRHGATSGWQTDGLAKDEGDGYFGLGGVSISARHAGESVFIEAECSQVGVYYLQRPGGGELKLFDNDRLVKQFSTNGRVEASMISYRTRPGSHTLKLLTVENRPVRLLGWSNDNDSGVTYESFGINGAEASIFFRWKRTMMANYFKLRAPALIVLAYGSNEATDNNWTAQSYKAMFSALLKRLRDDCPAASILVLGPPDRLTMTRAGLVDVRGIDQINAAQRMACRENGCAYWGAKTRMGGAGSIRTWLVSGWAQPDYVHLTPSGYDKLAGLLFSDIMGLYDWYLKSGVVTQK